MSDLWRRVDRNGPVPQHCPELGPCWIWTGTRHRRNGYGVIGVSGRQYRAHRVAWILTNGPIPAGLFVCHECDNPPCCNPAHLRVDDHHGNVRDKVKRNRQAKGAPHSAVLRRVVPRGSLNARAKLTEDQVRDIRLRAHNGERYASIAARFGVIKSCVTKIIYRITWKHVT